ncbi:hypothetical protein [Lyngbya sp. CCY1209]|jgi:hypothetical protein|uniref:hypothetical protein n=1 Tax=Lyngbya sp. CCY1209 TaxID=2886103 RepID=UPI002D204E19|nr:hypothetical protein [Lyngbya sp. CCY1209]MEB3884583.1 hypothetical protein [Lyngbya sp. CCY1209]
MTNRKALRGTELIDCAKSSAPQGLERAASNCGYGDDIEAFQSNLKQACQEIGLKDFKNLNDLITDRQRMVQQGGVEIAPDSQTSL